MLQLCLKALEVVRQALVLRVTFTRQVLGQGRPVKVLILDACLAEDRILSGSCRPFRRFYGLCKRRRVVVIDSRSWWICYIAVLFNVKNAKRAGSRDQNN